MALKHAFISFQVDNKIRFIQKVIKIFLGNFFFLLIPILSYSQEDSIKIDFSHVFMHSLSGNIPQALEALETKDDKRIIKRHLTIKNEIADRFSYETDESNYSAKRAS